MQRYFPHFLYFLYFLYFPTFAIFSLLLLEALFVRPLEAQQTGALSARRPQSLNPDISLDGLFSAGYFSEAEHLNLGGHDPKERGFTVQNIEASLLSVVDPYFQGEAHIIFGLDHGESFLELEEVFLTSLALPFNLQLRAGQFFTRFGRINSIHPHTWDFADQLIINNRLLGPDGLRSVGAQLSYLLPLPFYLELITSAQNAFGETAVSFLNIAEEGEENTFLGYPIIDRKVKSLSDLLYMTRINSSLDFTDTTTMLIGASSLFGPNGSGEGARTKILGADLYLKWRPIVSVRGWPFISWQSEIMWRDYEAGEAGETNETQTVINLKDWGLYTQFLYGFRPRWVLGARSEYAKGEDEADPLQDRRYRLSANITFYPSEFSKWRLQYNYDVSESREDEPIHAVFLQWEFLMGAHGAHQF